MILDPGKFAKKERETEHRGMGGAPVSQRAAAGAESHTLLTTHPVMC